MPEDIPARNANISIPLISNARQMPKVYYGLHFYPGVAEYPGKAANGAPNRLLVTEKAIRNMEPSFTGKPIYVEHIDGAPNLSTLQIEADGYVVESFFNQADGKHWAKLLIVSDAGHAAVAKGLRLSNAYKPSVIERQGVWNSIPFQHELMGGEFEHMALVSNPRYNESVILTPEEFAAHNAHCLEGLRQAAVRNSEAEQVSETQPSKPKEGALTMAFNFFKKTPVEADAESLITLKNGKTVNVEQLIELANSVSNDDSPETQPTPILGGSINEDKAEAGEAKGKAPNTEEAKDQDGEPGALEGSGSPLANLDHHVMINGTSTKLSDLMASHEKMCGVMNALSEHLGKMKAPTAEAAPAAPESEDSAPASKEKEDASKQNSIAESDDDFMTGILEGPDFFKALSNAAADAPTPKQAAPSMEGSQLGKSRYGSR